MLKQLFDYAGKRREEGVYDMTDIMQGYLKDYLDSSDAVLNGKNNFAKRFRELAKEYVETDPRYQSRMDQFRGD